MTKAATKAATPKAKKAKSNYSDFRAKIEAGKGVTIQGRDNTPKKARKYSLTDEQKAKIEAEAKALGLKTINPLIRNGVNKHGVQALIDLGINKWHGLKETRDTMKELMRAVPKKNKDGTETNLWTAFYNKPSREGALKPLVGDDKIVQNFRVLQRVGKNGDNHPYGLPLAQYCMSVDIEFKDISGELVPMFRLNTTWKSEAAVEPVYANPGAKRGRKAGSKNTSKANKPAKAQKPAKATPKAQKPVKKVKKVKEAPVAEAPVVETPVVETPVVETQVTEARVETPTAPADDSQDLK